MTPRFLTSEVRPMSMLLTGQTDESSHVQERIRDSIWGMLSTLGSCVWSASLAEKRICSGQRRGPRVKALSSVARKGG